MSLLDRYIARHVLYSTAVVFAVLLALFAFLEFVDKVGDLGKGSFDVSDLLEFVILGLPRKAYELFPMAALLGTTLGLSSLAIDSELTAMRAAGVSLLRIAAAVMRVGAVLVFGAILIGEVLAPPAENYAQRERAAAMQVGFQERETGIWLRDGHQYINIGEVLPDLTVLRVNIFEFDEQQRLRTHTSAASGHFDGERWRLDSVKQSVLEPRRVRVWEAKTDYWTTAIDHQVLGVFAVAPDALSVWNLYRYIDHLKRNKQDTGRYELAFWYKVVAPLTIAAMVLLAVPFVFGHPRDSGMGLRLFVGIMLGLLFYLLSRGFGYFSVLYQLPPLLGAVLPTVLFLFLALYLLRRVA